MNCEDYLDPHDEDGIRFKGHRIWLNDLMDEILSGGSEMGALLERFPSLSREKVAAALAYVENNRPAVMRLYEDDRDRKSRNAQADREKGLEMIANLAARRVPLARAGNA